MSRKSVVGSWQWLMSASASAGRIARSIARPESMTAYATLAAALAAFLSLKAAERQEKATFTSNLYSKQVDTIALFAEKYIPFIMNVYSYYEKKEDYKKNENVVHELYTSTQSSRLTLENAMLMLDVLYPKETQPFMKELSLAESSVWISLGDAPSGEPMSESRKKELGQFNQLAAKLLQCSREQLRDGANVEGRRFSDCVKEKQSGT
jgi:hypothetical protein